MDLPHRPKHLTELWVAAAAWAEQRRRIIQAVRKGSRHPNGEEERPRGHGPGLCAESHGRCGPTHGNAVVGSSLRRAR